MRWLSENSPSLETWQLLLEKKGFSAIEDPAWREMAYAQMPESARNSASAYLSENHRILALRVSGDWLYYSLSGRSGSSGTAIAPSPPGKVVPRELWESTGIGWEAFALIERTQFPITRPASSLRGPHVEWQDSRSIEY